MTSLLEESKLRAEQWLASPVVDDASKSKIRDLITSDDNRELIDSFYRSLEFGTGGLRGIMGIGPNTMNRYTVGIATQGLANYMKKSFPAGAIKVAVAYDSRNNSAYFAEVVSAVFSANDIEVHLFPELRPTPLLSFAIRYLKCHGGVVITASHNPKEYNGYKAYWQDGAQLVPPHDNNVITEVNAIKGFEQVKFTANKSKIISIGKEVEEAYYNEVKTLIPKKDAIQRQANLPIVYSSLHGAGITMVPECLKRLGFTNVNVVEEQMKPDGNFPTVQSPNPEERSAMKMALEKGKQVNAELIMATDPDTDRVGIAFRNPNGEFILLNGNQALSIMLWFIMKNLAKLDRPYIAKTIVTTELIDTMAKSFGVECINTLTGFKYIAELIRANEGKKTFVAAGEESYGYMVGAFVRDKDAVSACAFFAAMAAAAKAEGEKLFDWLIKVYVEFGFFKEGLVNITKKGAEGEQQIKAMMDGFRKNPPRTIAGETVTRILDYKTSEEQNLETGTKAKINQPKSDVLQFYTKEGAKISVRPSGTEPKIKFYISVNSKLKSAGDFDRVNTEQEERINNLGKATAQ
jgi:phosphoglucomutase